MVRSLAAGDALWGAHVQCGSCQGMGRACSVVYVTETQGRGVSDTLCLHTSFAAALVSSGHHVVISEGSNVNIVTLRTATLLPSAVRLMNQ